MNNGKQPCTGLTFRQTKNIVCDDTYTPIGYYVSSSDKSGFRGTYDGQGFTVSDITVSRTGNTSADSYVGLFGFVYYNSSSDYGTVQNCRVESSVTIKAGQNYVYYHGGIVGDNSNGHVIGCYSAVAVSGLSGTPYVLSIDSSAIAFRRFTGDAIPAGKAYYMVTP